MTTILHGKMFDSMYLRQQYQDIARLAYYANQEARRLSGREPTEDWDSLSRLAHDIYCSVVQTIIENPDTTPETQHKAWCDSKKQQGWKYGKEVCKTNKTLPNLVDFDELNLRDKIKHYVIISVVIALARDRGLL